MRTLDPFASETLPWMKELGGVARRFAGRRRDVAEDLVQETYLRALAAQHRYQPGTNARAWLHAILANTAHANYRRERRDLKYRERYFGELSSGAFSGSSDGPGEGPGGRSVLSLLERLPAPLRRTVELVDVEERSYLEAAKILDCPIGTVMSRLYRGRRRLRAILEDSEGSTEHRQSDGGEAFAA